MQKAPRMKIERLTPHVRIRRLICTRIVSDTTRNLRAPFLIASTARRVRAADCTHRGPRFESRGYRGAVRSASLTLTRARCNGGFARLTVASSLKRATGPADVPERQRGVFVRAPGDFAGNDSLRSGNCHAMFVSVMSRKCARLMAACKNDRNAQLFLSLRTRCLE